LRIDYGHFFFSSPVSLLQGLTGQEVVVLRVRRARLAEEGFVELLFPLLKKLKIPDFFFVQEPPFTTVHIFLGEACKYHTVQAFYIITSGGL
jgi:hypothetical protein